MPSMVISMESEKSNKLARISAFIYGVVCYVIFFSTFLYTVGFVGNLIVPRSIDSAANTTLTNALVINFSLLGIFGLQHSLMARQWFKNWWTQIVPKPVERSTYVLFSSLCLIALFYFWQPMGIEVWNVENSWFRIVLYSLFAFGWLLVLVSTFSINHFDLFGLRQVYLYLIGREYTQLQFKVPNLYKLVRHPLYVGWFLAFWATPTMTLAHLVFALGTTAYIVVAIQFEERDLLEAYGQAYADYQDRVPMLIPFKRDRP